MFHDSLTHLCITPAIEHDLPAVDLLLSEQNGKYSTVFFCMHLHICFNIKIFFFINSSCNPLL